MDNKQINNGDDTLGEDITSNEETKKLGLDYSLFVLDSIDKIEQEERIKNEELERQIKLREQENDKKLSSLLKYYKGYSTKFLKYSAKYPKKISIIKNIFLNIGVIKTSSLHSKDKLENSIFNFFDTENLFGFENFLSNLLKNGEGKQGFPIDIVNALFAIKNDFEKLFPKLIDEEVKNDDNNPWSTGGKIR